MKEVLGSLPEVITAYKNYNLLVPTATDVQLNPFYKFHVEEVPVDLGENSGDIFKVGSVKTGKQDERGKDIWEDVFSLSKPLLNKMAMAAGIQFNPKETYGERIDRVTYRAQAQGAMRKADGTARTETDQKVICLEDEEEKYRIEFADKAAKGITDEKQAQAAAEIFSGQWVESKNKWGKKCQAFVIAKEDRDRYIDRSVMVNMALLKKTWAEKAMTGAKLRVIRALLGVKGTYTKAELQKNFAIPTVIFSPDFSDPQVRQAMLTQGMNSVNNMFGTLGPWNRQDVLRYIVENDVEICSIYGDIRKSSSGLYYTTGEQRTGCMFCAFGAHMEECPNRFQRMAKTHPKHWKICMNLENNGVRYQDALLECKIETETWEQMGQMSIEDYLKGKIHETA